MADSAYNVIKTQASCLRFILTNAISAYDGNVACIDTATQKVTVAIVGTPKTTLLPVGTFYLTSRAAVVGDGTATVEVQPFEPGAYYWFKNSGTNAVTASHVGLPCYIEEGAVVGSLVTGRSVMGTVIAIDSTKGVLVAPRLVNPAAADLIV